MSKRSERRAAERAANKSARVQSQQTNAAAASSINQPAANEQHDAVAANEAFMAEIQAARVRTRELMAQFAREATEEGEANEEGETNEEAEPASEAQINANRENAKLSTGPSSSTGKQTVSQNRRSHGLIGKFMLQPDESQSDYDALVDEVYEEYKPKAGTETRLAQSLIQHYWLMQRAIRLQENNFRIDDKKLALYMRYQTTHERSYYKAQKELRQIQKEAAKSEIGFERQNRKDENTEARTRLAHAKALTLEVDAACRQVMEAPIPGNHKLTFEELTKACSVAICTLVAEKRQSAGA